jgi:hypothetical protein
VYPEISFELLAFGPGDRGVPMLHMKRGDTEQSFPTTWECFHRIAESMLEFEREFRPAKDAGIKGE